MKALAASVASVAIAGSSFAQSTCLNIASNNVLNLGNIGSYIGGGIGDNNFINVGDTIACSPIQGAFQANQALQAAFQSGIPVTLGLFAFGGQNIDQDIDPQANLSKIQCVFPISFVNLSFHRNSSN
jgi:hypothetical protein